MKQAEKDERKKQAKVEPAETPIEKPAEVIASDPVAPNPPAEEVVVVTQAEKDAKIKAARERLTGRISDLRERRSELMSQISAVSLESAMGDAAAEKAEATAKAEIAQVEGQIGTIDRAIEWLDREFEQGKPAREAEAREHARKMLSGHSHESLRLAGAFVDALRTAAYRAELYEDHRASTDGAFRKASGGDGYSYPRPVSVVDLIFVALKEAGFGRFDPQFAAASNQGLVAQNATALRYFAPDHPACIEAQRRADQFLREEIGAGTDRATRLADLRLGDMIAGARIERIY